MRVEHLILLIAVFCNACVAPQRHNLEDSSDLNHLGIKYRLLELTNPVPNRVHILTINLPMEKITPKVVLGEDPDGDGPTEALLTDPRKLASNQSVVAFVNTNPWDSFPDAKGKRNRKWYSGQSVDIHGLAGTEGKMRSTIMPSNTSVWFDPQGRVYFGHQSGDAPKEATNGFQLILSNGQATVNTNGARHPRTAIGSSKSGELLSIVVVDGRQPQYSEGMNLYELAKLMKKIGCWKATNMDGGGSSIMGLTDMDGKLRIMNSPSDRKFGRVSIRPLPMILTFENPDN